MTANADIHALVAKTMKDWHPDLIKAQVKIGVIMALAARETQPALKENGHQVEGTIKIVSPKDRISKNYDAEMLLDGDEWTSDRPEHKVAKIDRLLCRLEMKKPKPKKKKHKAAVHGSEEETAQHEEPEFETDDGGRPKLKIRKGDWNSGYGFRDVVLRHGNFAPEIKLLNEAKAIVESVMTERAAMAKSEA